VLGKELAISLGTELGTSDGSKDDSTLCAIVGDCDGTAPVTVKGAEDGSLL
jgi:hypothetical protein